MATDASDSGLSFIPQQLDHPAAAGSHASALPASDHGVALTFVPNPSHSGSQTVTPPATTPVVHPSTTRQLIQSASADVAPYNAIEPHVVPGGQGAIEVGLTDGLHRGLRVRAEWSDAGEVVASLLSPSTGAAESLRSQVGPMLESLRQEALTSVSIAVHDPHDPQGHRAALPSTQTFSGGALFDTSTGGGARDHAPEARAQALGSSVTALETAALPLASGSSDRGPSLTGNASGGWLSIRV